MKLFHSKRQVLYLAIFLAVALAAIGILIWARPDEPVPTNTSTIPNQANEDVANPAQPDPYAKWKTYEDEAGRFSFKYPDNWQTLKCSDDRDDPAVYFGTDKRNLGFTDADSPSILCGGGTDFPPQAILTIYPAKESGNIYDTKNKAEKLTIDGYPATKSREVA